MRNRTRIGALAAVAALVVSVLALQPATATDFHEEVSGNFIDTSLDLGPEGGAANYFSGVSKGNGSASYEGLLEIAFTAPTGACATGDFQGDVVAYSMVRRYSNGDLLTSELVGGVLCFNPVSGASTLRIDAVFTGGTGQFVGATGSYTAEYDVQRLVPDPAGGIAHGTFSGEVNGTN